MADKAEKSDLTQSDQTRTGLQTIDADKLQMWAPYCHFLDVSEAGQTSLKTFNSDWRPDLKLILYNTYWYKLFLPVLELTVSLY